MFFLKMISRSFSRQFKRRLLIAVTVCLSATVSVAMLGVVFDVGDKLNAELSTYGSNITVQPKADAVVSDLLARLRVVRPVRTGVPLPTARLRRTAPTRPRF